LATGFQGRSDEVEERQARRWFETSNPATYVGSKHHTVPSFCLKQFTDDGKHLSVWRRSTERIDPSPVADLAIRDFYTVLTHDGQLDGRMEEMLGRAEDQAEAVFKQLRLPFRRPGPLTAEQQAAICQFLAFQLVRGPRKRKEIELFADYGWKIQDDGSLTERDLRELVAVPHPNEHIRLMGPTSQAIYNSILRRPAQVMRLDAPLLVICDEPVLIDIDEHVQHLPECSFSQGALRRRQRREAGNRPFQQTVHVWPTRPSGVERADAIAMPLSPSTLIVLGRIGEAVEPDQLIIGDEAQDLANEVNTALVAQAYEWVAARPSHPTFSNWTFPLAGPLLGVCDGGSIMSEQLRSAPIHRWQRIRKTW
jgi:hypothetical protein